jgi:thioredoxin-related protein
MPRTQFLAISLASIAFLLNEVTPAAAQDVRWRHDYSAARRESVETGKPLFVDFSTESCFWCKKLDAVTWRDPKIVKRLNEQFIPVKLDGEKETGLVKSLQIDGYPTLIVATAEGKVVGRHAGFLDAAQMTSLLGKAPPAVKSPAPAKAAAVSEPVPNTRPANSQLDEDLAALHMKIAASLER